MSKIAQAISLAHRNIKSNVAVNFVNGSNQDIITTILNNVPKATKQLKSISHKFEGRKKIDTARNIYSFLKNEIKYIPDTSAVQKSKLPSALVREKHGDCKSYSLFASAVLRNLGIKHIFRFASYNGNTIPSHVYIVIPGSEEIIIDGTLPIFNYEAKNKSSQKDYIMKIETITGAPNNNHPVGSWLGDKANQFKNWTKETVDDAGDAARDAAKKAEDAAKKIRDAVVKYNPLGVLARNSFLGLVSINFRGFATYLNRLSGTKKQDLYNRWKKFGGSQNAIMRAILDGSKKQRIFGASTYVIVDRSGKTIGAEPVTTTTALAAAAAIIASLNDLIKEGKDLTEKTNKIIKDGKSIVDDGKKIIDDGKKIINPDSKKTTIKKDVVIVDTDDDSKKKFTLPSFEDNKLMYGVAALVVAKMTKII